MKIRSGFVSNSSSSSFVVIAPTTAVRKVLTSLKNEYERECVKHVMSESKFLGTNICIFQGVSGDYDAWENDFSGSDYDGYKESDDDSDDDFSEESVSPNEVFDEFVNKLKEETKDVIEVNIDY